MSGGINTTRKGATIGVEGERKMADEHGNYGFRTEMRNNPDGSVTMLRTRDGWNEFTTTGNKSISTYPRGFGMSPAASLVSTLFVPDDWRTLTKSYKPLQPTYFVMPLATNFAFNPKENHRWNDVLSWQGDEVRVNGRNYNPTRAAIETPAQCVPVYVSNSTSSEGNEYYTSGHLFMVSKIAVYSVGQTEVTRYAMTPETPMQEGQAYLAGPKISGATAKLLQLFFAGGSTTGFWSFLHASMVMGSDGSVDVTNHSAFPCWTPGAVPDSVAYSSATSQEGYALPDTLIGWNTQLQIDHMNYDGGEEHFLESIEMVYLSTGSALTTGTNSSCHWIEDVAAYSGSAGAAYDMAGETISLNGGCEKTRKVGAGYVWREQQTYQPPDQYNESYGESIMTATHGWWTHDAPGVPQNSPVGIVTFPGGEVDVNLRQNREQSTCSARSTLALGSVNLVDVSVNRFDEWGSFTHATTSSYVNGADGEIVARARVSAEIPVLSAYPPGLTDEEMKKWLAEWKAYRAGVAGMTSGALGGGVSMYAGMNVIHHNGQGQLLPYTIARNQTGKSVSSITFSTKDYFLYDTENQVYGSISSVFTADEENGSGCTATLTVTLSITYPQGSYDKQLCSLTLPMSDILPLVVETSGIVSDYLPSPAYSCMFAPKIRTQGCFHGIAYTTVAEHMAGAMPHFLANFKLSLCGHNGGNEDSEDSGTGNSLVVMPGHLIEMLHCYVYSSSYGMDPDYSYPIQRVATYNTIQKGLFEKSWVVHLHNNDQGNWTGNVDLANFNLTTTGIFRT